MFDRVYWNFDYIPFTYTYRNTHDAYENIYFYFYLKYFSY